MRSLLYLSEKYIITFIVLSTSVFFNCSSGQEKEVNSVPIDEQKQAIADVINAYVQARETRDTAKLKDILTSDIDQLTSSGNWRYGISASIQGMQRSSSNNPGKRTITIENIRLLNGESAIVDTRYEIENADGSVRKMWSTFIVKQENQNWKITAIRNMLPVGN